MEQIKIGDNSRLFSNARRTGVAGVIELVLTNVPAGFDINPMPVFTVPIFGTSLMFSGYSKLIQRLNSNITGGTKGWIRSIFNTTANLINAPLRGALYVVSDGTLLGQAEVRGLNVNYLDVASCLNSCDILRISNIRFTIPNNNFLQTKENIYFFDQDIFGHLSFNPIDIFAFFNPLTNKSGLGTASGTSNEFIIDMPVDYFVNDKFGIAFDVLSHITGMRVSLTCEQYFNNSFVNSKKLL